MVEVMMDPPRVVEEREEGNIIMIWEWGIIIIELHDLNQEHRLLLHHRDMFDDRNWQGIIVWERKSWVLMKFHSRDSRGRMIPSR